MKYTGTQVKGDIKILTAKLAALNTAFPKSLSFFPGEIREDPVGLADKILDYERQLAGLQDAQKYINQHVAVTVDGKPSSLQYAINVVGAFSRMAKLWKEAAGVKKKERYDYSSSARSSRSTDTIEASPTITAEQAMEYYENAERVVTDLRRQIGIANNVEVEILDDTEATAELIVAPA